MVPLPSPTLINFGSPVLALRILPFSNHQALPVIIKTEAI